MDLPTGGDQRAPGTDRWPRRRWWPAAAGYALFFALLLLPMPLEGALPGNCDTWLNGIALPNIMLDRLHAGLTGEQAGTSFYPERRIFGFGESAFGTSALFMLFKIVARDDVAAYYLFMVAILALDSLGVFLLARFYTRGAPAAAFAGLAFTASNYILGSIDSPHTAFFFIAFLCLYQCKRYLVTGERGAILLAALLGAAQVYFSAYIFLFMSLAAAALFVAHLHGARDRARVDRGTLLRAAAIFVVVAAPFFGFYAAAKADPNFTNPWDSTLLAELHSLEPADLARTLENNLLYRSDGRIRAPELGQRTRAMVERGAVQARSLTSDDARIVLGRLSSPDDVKYFVYTRRCAFLGLVLYALAGIGLWRPGAADAGMADAGMADAGLADTGPAASRRRELAGLYLAALLVSFGPFVSVGETLIPNVMYPAYKWLGAAGALRVPSRAFSFAVLAVVLAAAAGLERLGALAPLRTRGRRGALFGLLTLAVLAENVPLPLKSFAGRRLATPEPLVREFFADRRGDVLLDLPSQPGGALYRDSHDLFEWNRELIYMNRQTYHRQSIVNGVHGYFPRSRLLAQRLINQLPAGRALAGLREIGVNYIVYHRSLEFPWEAGLYRDLIGAPELVVVASAADVTIFGWAPGPERPAPQ